MKSYENVPDTRPLDVWGKPIGKPYKEKDWNSLTPEEMMADFDWKSDILDSYGEEISQATFYQDYLFRELYEGTLQIKFEYKILLTEYNATENNKIHKVDVDDIQDYLHLNDVAISPCLFYANWRKKRLLNYVSAFVLDIDKLRPWHLQRFIRLFEEGRLLMPTFIANSGSGVHFYYLLDKMLRCDSNYHEAENQIAEEVYKGLYNEIIKKERWSDAQMHWIGQDYRVVNSRTKLNQISRIYKVGETYTIEQLMKYFGIKIDRSRRYASKKMVKYAGNIARDLKLDPPDYTNAKETYAFIKTHKDEAYQFREKRREERAKKAAKGKKSVKRPVTWYKNTLAYMQDHTQPGHRFSAMKALAIIGFKESVPREVFIEDIEELSEYWSTFNWKGDHFNKKNVEAIIRLFDGASKYSNTTSEVLEQWLGYEFKRIGNKRNGRSQEQHIKVMNAIRDVEYPEGNWRNKKGAPTKQEIILEWRKNNPDGKKIDCERATGLSRHTVLKWWDGEAKVKAVKKPKKASKQEKIVTDLPTDGFMPANPDSTDNSDVKREILQMLLNMSDQERADFWKTIEEESNKS